MESKDISALKENPKNPRKISRQDFDNLKNAIKRWGDLSCIVFNIQTGQLVCGHQRMQAFNAFTGPKDLQVQRLDTPTKQGTVAVGQLVYDGETYKYREVNWDASNAEAAGIAANRIQGENDLEKLAELNYELAQLDDGEELLALSGQSEKELKRLNKMIGLDEPDMPTDNTEDTNKVDRLEFSLTAEQRETIEEALNNIKATKDLLTEQNASLNGAALFWVCREYLDRLHMEAANNPPIAPVVPGELVGPLP